MKSVRDMESVIV